MTLPADVLSVLQSCSKDQESYERLVELFRERSQKVEGQAYNMQLLYRTLTSSLSDVSILTYGHDLRYHSAEGSEALQLNPDMLVGKRLRDVMPEEIWKRDEPKLLAALNGESTLSDLEYNGRFYRVYTYPVRNEENRVVSGAVVSFDVTELRQMEAARIERERLETTLRLETDLSELKSALMARISHEFRTPLAIIQTAAELLERYIDRMPAEDRVRRTKQIQAHVQYLAALLSEINLLVSGRVRRPMLATAFDMVSVSREIMSLIAATIGSGRKLNIHSESTVVMLQSDIDLVSLIIRHLLTDSVMRSTASEGVDLLIQEGDENVSLTVCCTTLGDSNADIMMNELFYRRSTEGITVGIGEMRMAKDAVRMLGGTLEISTDRESGLCFYVVLPKVQPQTQQVETGMFG